MMTLVCPVCGTRWKVLGDLSDATGAGEENCDDDQICPVCADGDPWAGVRNPDRPLDPDDVAYVGLPR